MKPKLSYIVCSTPRTGSSLLCAGLRDMGICGVPYEYFHPDSPDRVVILSKGARTFQELIAEILAAGTTSNGIFGVKIHWVDFNRLIKWMREMEPYRGRSVSDAMHHIFPNVRYIYIRRRDKIRQAISFYKATRSGLWTLRQEKDCPPIPPLKYDYLSIYKVHQALVREDAAWEAYFRKHSIEPLMIIYEELIESYQPTLEKVLEFIGATVPPRDAFPAPPLKCLSDGVNDLWYKKYIRTPVWLGKSHSAWMLFQKNRSRFVKHLLKKIGFSVKRKLLFVTDSLFYPECLGGSELSHLYLLKSLKKRGWEVRLICRTKKMNGNGGSFHEDASLGFVRWASTSAPGAFRIFVGQKIRDFQPDIIVSYDNGPALPQQMHILRQIALSRHPTVCFVRTLENLEKLRKTIWIPSRIHLIANSPFTRETLMKNFSEMNCVGMILPFIFKKEVKSKKKKRIFITLINAVPEKGVDIFLDIAARMPHQRFLLIKGRWASLVERPIKDRWLAKAEAMTNVEVWDAREDMRSVYAVTDILLMPSQFVETFGRVIVEAHNHGIPVVASNVGGIPFTMGKGGILVNPKDDVDLYVAAVESLKKDRSLYDRFSEAALQNSRRPEFDPEYQVGQFIACVDKVLHAP